MNSSEKVINEFIKIASMDYKRVKNPVEDLLTMIFFMDKPIFIKDKKSNAGNI